jgi:predicted acylesterase/phospholipase RssA
MGTTQSQVQTTEREVISTEMSSLILLNKIENLVFEGGGVKGLAYVGCITVLERLGILQNIKRVAGSSAGSIQAAFLACGSDSTFLKKKIWSKNFSDFLDGGSVVHEAMRFFSSHGIHKGAELERWIEECLFELTGEPNITFEMVNFLFRKFSFSFQFIIFFSSSHFSSFISPFFFSIYLFFFFP